MRHFAELVRQPGLARVLGTQLAARFPAGMYSLGLLIHVEHAKGNYTAAGMVLAAFSVGMAVAGPIVSRQLSRFGTTFVLLLTLALSCAAFVGVALFPGLPLPAVMAMAAVGGAAMPPVIPTVRTLYPRLSPRNLLTALFSLDAALQEIIWVIGPVLITVLVAVFGSTTALLVVVAIQVAGGLVFALDPLVRQLRIPAATRKFGRVLSSPSVVLMVVVSLLMIGSFAAVEAAVVASFGEGSINAGIVLAISAVGSLLGGLAAGNRPIGRWSLALRLVIIVGGFGIAAVSSGFWGLAVALFVAGLGIAPALAAVSNIIAGSVSFAETAEAYGWIGTGQLLGASIGSATAGIAIDAAGGTGGIYVAAGIAVLAFVTALVFRTAQPDPSAPVID
ncbi:MFS transporter [Tessaracoccus flavus]|nr:MFS transporter [Tessaracoccus flavus]SDY91257.1 Predicted arabinose efflux permease, MFS family [Tessaracoccus flavus]